MSDAKTAAAKFKSKEYNYDQYKGGYIDEKISQVEEQTNDTINEVKLDKEWCKLKTYYRFVKNLTCPFLILSFFKW